jgi:hypothetical protein
MGTADQHRAPAGWRHAPLHSMLWILLKGRLEEKIGIPSRLARQPVDWLDELM